MSYGKNAFMLLIGISFILYLFGYESTGSMLIDNICVSGLGWDICTGFGLGSYLGIMSVIGAFVVASVFLAGGTSTATTATMGSSFSVIYTIPLALIVIIVSIVFLPLNFVNEVGLPDELSTMIYLFFGVLILLSTIDFIKGGDY